MKLIWFSMLLFINSAFAYNGESTKIDSVLQALLDYLTSAPARIIAVLAIVGVGYATLHLGRMPKQRAIAVVIGVGIIFGGAALLQMLGLGG
ncbi:MAG: TrbC/VirB2 family protein [Coxiellaceae bacterium]|nr:TrbC/VirB2 family protein [Coxiellaceae bacterium]